MTDTELREELAVLLMQCSMELEMDGENVICDRCGIRPISESCVAIADYLIANGVTFGKDTDVPNKWIPVTERLPEQYHSVIVWTSDGELGEASHDGKQFRWAYDDEYANVTHWMPLPEPPEE